MSAKNSVSPVFVVGMPRSGTKLLRTLLNEHPQISILGVETEFLPAWKRRWASFGPMSRWDNFQSFYNWNMKLTYFYLFKQEIGPVIGAREWYNLCDGKFDIASVFEALARRDAKVGAKNAILWGDKSPSYIRHIASLDSIFPEARFIHIVRDVRDYAPSLNKAFGKNILRATQRWADDVMLAHTQGQHIGKRYMELTYENLITQTQTELEHVCAFLGVDFTPEMLTLSEPAEKDFEHQRGVGTGRKDIVSGNKEKWRRKMEPALRKNIEEIAGDTLKALGYPTEFNIGTKRLSPISMATRQFMDGYNILRSNQRFGLIEAIRFYGRAYLQIAPSHIRKD